MTDVMIPKDLKGKDLFEFLMTNKSILVAQKKFELKRADAVFYSSMFVNEKGDITKANELVTEDLNVLKVRSVINTTNLMDSHSDVHIPGLWKKSLSENKQLFLLEEHKMSFRGIITDEIKAFTKKMSWRDLGLDADGVTEALIFDNTIKRIRNEFMFDQYKQGNVKNHSVGMRYVDLELAINDPDYKQEFANWNKYIDDIVNRDEAEAQGFFWPVKEAKCIEGSAVPLGSNWVTPTLDNNMKHSQSTEKEPLKSTSEQPRSMSDAIKQTTFVKI